MSEYKVIINGEHVGYTKEFKVEIAEFNHELSYDNRFVYTPTPTRTVSFDIAGGFKYTRAANGVQWVNDKYWNAAIKRPSFDEYFLGIADAVAVRGDCVSRQIGAVIVGKDRRIVSTGYNGVPPNSEGCLSSPCPRATAPSKCPGYSDCRSTHAEANALLYADYAKCVKATLYISDKPCEACLKLIKAARIKRVVWPNGEMKL